MAGSSPAGASGGQAVCVLSGGALKTVSHLGAVRHFRERGLSFDGYVGCSGGAILGALLAAGHDPLRVLEILTERVRSILLGLGQPKSHGFLPGWFSGWGRGLAEAGIITRILGEYLPGDDFDMLPVPLSVNAIHLRTGLEVLFTGGGSAFSRGSGLTVCRRQPVTAAVAASISLPVAFKPARLVACRDCPDRSCGLPRDPREDDGFHFIDGGFLSHLPLAAAASAGASFILGLHARLESAARGEPVGGWSLVEIIHKAADIVIQDQISRAREALDGTGPATVVLAPPVWEYGFFDGSAAALRGSFQAGHATARRFLDSLGLPGVGKLSWDELLGRLPGGVTVFSLDSL